MTPITHDLLPWHLWHALDPRNRTTLANARRATEEIGRAVAERRNLAASLDAQGETPPDAGTHEPHVPHEPHLRGDRQLVVLTEQECLRLLATRTFGRLAFVYRPGVPLILPVNYTLDDEAVVLRSGQGPKLQAAERGDRVSFEVDDIDEATRQGWSVVVTGRARRVRGAD